MEGLREATGRVNQLKSSLQMDGERIKPAALQAGEPDEDKVDAMLEREKEKLQGSIVANADRMSRIQADLKSSQGSEVQSSPPAQDADGGGGDIASLKEELLRQKQMYMAAQRAYQTKEEAEARERANGKQEEEAREIERDIQHYKKARHEIDQALVGGGDAPGGAGGVGNRAVGVASAAPSQVLQAGSDTIARPIVDHEVTDDAAVAAQEAASRPRASRNDDGGIVGAFDKALGDSVEMAKDAGHERGKIAAGPRHALPGIVTDSWWAAPPKETPHELQAQAAAKRAAVSKKRDCHNLYACVGSFFTSDGGKGRGGKADVLHLGEVLRPHKPHAVAAKQAGDKVEGDHLVSTATVEENPQEPLLRALMPSASTHTSKLPGVAENRWGGSKFWSRLLGIPASHAKHAEHRKRMKLTH